MTSAVAAVRIHRPVGDVYAFLSDPTNMPKFLGDVTEVTLLNGTRSRWTIALPLGLRTHWVSTIVSTVPDRRLWYDAAFAGRIIHWRLTFVVDGESTVVNEQMMAQTSVLARVALRVAGKNPQAEVEANLHRLQQLLETGRITDHRYAVGKTFA